MKASVVVVAAGRGERFGEKVPKAYFSLKGKPILAYSLEIFEAVPEVSEIVVVLSSGMMGDAWTKHMKTFDLKKLSATTSGGATRADSVWDGLQKTAADSEIVLVHDAARPLVKSGLVRNVISGAARWGAAIPGLPVKPTLKEVDAEGFILKTHDRGHLWEAQTPQGFRREILMKAYEAAGSGRSDATDEAFLVERMGHRVKVIEGDESNIKITTQEDLKLAELILGNRTSA